MQAGAISWDFEWFNIIKICQRILQIIQCVPFIILSLSGDETGWGEARAWRTKGKMKHRDLRRKAQRPCEDAKDIFEAWKMRANQQPLAEHQIKAALFPVSALNVKGTAWAVLAGLPHGSPCAGSSLLLSQLTNFQSDCLCSTNFPQRTSQRQQGNTEWVRNASYGSLSFQLLIWLLLKDGVCYH